MTTDPVIDDGMPPPDGIPMPDPVAPEPVEITDPLYHLLDVATTVFDPENPEAQPTTACGLTSDGSVLVTVQILRVSCPECRPEDE